MPGLSPDLSHRLRETLSRCVPFDSDRSLRAVFVDARIVPWRDLISDNTPSRAVRVDALIEALLEQVSDASDSALALFLDVLADRVSPGDACKKRLAYLAAELRELPPSPTEAKPAPSGPVPQGGKYEIHIHGGQVGMIGDNAHIEGGIHFGEQPPTAPADPEAALKRARRALEALEEQAAGYTSLTIPVNLKLELEDKRREVTQLERRGGASLQPSASAAGKVSDNPGHIPNPFCDRGCIRDPARFFGRQRLLREATQMLAQGNSLALIGEPQIGKSSLLYYLFATRADWLAEGTVLYLDLQAVLDEADFCAEVLERLDKPSGDLRALRQALRQRQTVLVLDEVEKLNDRTFSTRLHDLLRALAQEPTLTLAVAGHHPLAEIFPPSGTTSPFHNIFTEKQVPPFSAEESVAFLRARLAGTHIHFSGADIERLRFESAGRPLRLQQLACALFDSLRGA